MTIRYYISEIVGDGTSPSTAFRAAATEIAPGVQWQIHDCRADETSGSGEMLVNGDVDLAQHALLVADARVTYIPFEDVGGSVLGINDPIGQIAPANRTLIQTGLESRHIPIAGLTLTDEIYVIIQRYISRCRIRQYLKANDYTELLNNAISTIPSAKRQAISARLTELGFDLSNINGATLVREALVDLITQDITL